MSKYVIAIHGGAGNILPEYMTEELERSYTETLQASLRAGQEALVNGKHSLDAVEAAINVMEDSELFNAGKGAVFTSEGTNEMDASIMNGETGRAGAVGSVKTIRNPITAARHVMDSSGHVFLTGEGAEEFARSKGLAMEDPEYFKTELRWRQFQKIQGTDKYELDHTDEQASALDKLENNKFGTVGAVALDLNGNLAAGTSTGGLTNKKWGRVGDSPLIGAGTYANNSSCAVSCTGHGEYFIRALVAFDVSARMLYKGDSLDVATSDIIHKTLPAINGQGGLIAVDKEGNYAFPFNTPGMYRGVIRTDKEPEVLMYK